MPQTPQNSRHDLGKRIGDQSYPLALVIGFAAQLVLIFFVTTVGLAELDATDKRLRMLVEQHMLRLDLTKTMHAAARDRTMSLARMINMQDPFEHDEEQLRFTDYGRVFGIARRQLMALPLTLEEKKLLDTQRALTLRANPFQDEVITLSATDRRLEAQDVLTQKAIPAQDAVMQALSKLDDLTRQGANRAIQEASAAHAVARRWMLILSAAALLLGLGIATFVVRKIHRISQYRDHLATHDALTGLPNRVLLLARLDQAIALARRNHHHVGLLFIDLDGFKAVNDQHGHQAGDVLLQEIAHRLTQGVRASDIVARLGGDEFIVGVLEAHSEEQIVRVAEKLLQAIHQPVKLSAGEVTVSGSVGVCVYPEHGTSADDLLKSADAAMYAAKEAGKNQIHQFSAAA